MTSLWREPTQNFCRQKRKPELLEWSLYFRCPRLHPRLSSCQKPPELQQDLQLAEEKTELRQVQCRTQAECGRSQVSSSGNNSTVAKAPIDLTPVIRIWNFHMASIVWHLLHAQRLRCLAARLDYLQVLFVVARHCYRFNSCWLLLQRVFDGDLVRISHVPASTERL